MRRSILSVLFTSVLSFGITVHGLAANGQQPNAAPVNPHATPAARRLLLEIDGLSGHATLSGQHNFPNSLSRYSDRVYDLTGRYPALFGQDLGFASDPDRGLAQGRAELVKEVTRQYRAGAVIALTWHAVRPTDEEPVTFHGSVQAHLTDYEWKQLLTPGTDLYNRWCRQVDLVAGYLRELQDAGVPVLFRPYHEMNGNWFWWGGRPGPDGSAALYRQLYERYVHLHRLNNLVWVWNVNSPNGNAGPVDAYFPGPGYADVYSMDIYSTFEQSYYDSMVSLAGPTHPIALAEVGTMPTLEVLSRQPRWTYFMVWSSFEESANTPEQLATMYHATNIVVRGDPRLPPPAAEPSATPLPVTPDADRFARDLLVQLYSAAGRHALIGEEVVIAGSDAPQSGRSAPPAKSPATAAASEHAPAAAPGAPALIEFNVEDPDGKLLLPAIRAAKDAGQIVMIRWTPPRPSDGAATGLLTDYEWQQLLTPGTEIRLRWEAQVQKLAATLKQVQEEHTPVLWSPYPAANTEASWWGGRPGVNGSAALIRMLADRLMHEDQIHNLVWVWEPAASGSAPGGAGVLSEYFPGPLYVDALTLDVPAWRIDHPWTPRMLESFAGMKPVGLHIAAAALAPVAALLQDNTTWRWIALPPPETDGMPAAALSK